MKNVFKACLLFLLAGVVLVGCSTANNGSKEVQKIAIAYHPHYPGLAPALVAQEQGFFKDENLEAELVQFTAGPPELAAMASGDINFGFLGPGAHIFVMEGKGKVLVSSYNSLENDILVAKESGIKTMQDLKGKTIGITDGTAYELMLNLALEKAGMSRADVKTANLDEAGKLTAFSAGKIDAVSTSATYSAEIRNKMGEENVISLMTPEAFLPDNRFLNSWIVEPKFLEKNEEVTIRFLRAMLRGIDYQLNHEEETINSVAKFLNQDADSLRKQIERIDMLSVADNEQAFADGSVLTWYDNLIKMNINAGFLDEAKFVSSEKYVDVDVFKKAIESLKKDGLLK